MEETLERAKALEVQLWELWRERVKSKRDDEESQRIRSILVALGTNSNGLIDAQKQLSQYPSDPFILQLRDRYLQGLRNAIVEAEGLVITEGIDYSDGIFLYTKDLNVLEDENFYAVVYRKGTFTPREGVQRFRWYTGCPWKSPD